MAQAESVNAKLVCVAGQFEKPNHYPEEDVPGVNKALVRFAR